MASVLPITLPAASLSALILSLPSVKNLILPAFFKSYCSLIIDFLLALFVTTGFLTSVSVSEFVPLAAALAAASSANIAACACSNKSIPAFLLPAKSGSIADGTSFKEK